MSDAKRTDVRSRRETRGTRRRDRAIAREAAAPVRQDVFEVGEEGLPVMELATTLAVTPSEVVKILFMKGIMVQVNQVGAAVDQPCFVLCLSLKETAAIVCCPKLSPAWHSR